MAAQEVQIFAVALREQKMLARPCRHSLANRAVRVTPRPRKCAATFVLGQSFRRGASQITKGPAVNRRQEIVAIEGTVSRNNGRPRKWVREVRLEKWKGPLRTSPFTGTEPTPPPVLRPHS